MVDSFYSLHIKPHRKDELLIYVSAVIADDNNPNFQTVSLPNLVHQDKLIIRLWGKSSVSVSASASGWSLLAQYKVHLNNDLIRIPASVVNDTEGTFHKNAFVMKLSDGQSYTTAKCLDTVSFTSGDKEDDVGHGLEQSYTFDSIRAINSLYKSLVELSATKLKLSRQINELMEKREVNNHPIDISTLDKFVTKQKLINDTISSYIIRLKLSINEIKLFTSNHNDYTTTNEIEFINTQFEPILESLTTSVFPEILQQLRLSTSVIQQVFVIDNVSNSTKFQILGIEFPPTIKKLLEFCYYGAESEPYTVEGINSGLSYIARTIGILAKITNTSLKYKILNVEDKCFIHDISYDGNSPTASMSSSFPLYYCTEMNEKFANNDNTCLRRYSFKNPKFEFALSLLNWDLMLVIHRTNEIFKACTKSEGIDLQLNIPLDCLDNFLWNLQYLMLYLTALTK